VTSDVRKMWDDVHVRLDDLVRRSSDLVDDGRVLRGGSWQPYSIQKKSSNGKLARQRVEIAKSKRERYVPIGPFVASTYVSIDGTCPSTCTFKNAGCFAQAGAHHLTMGRLDRAARGMAPRDVSLAEAAGVAALWPRGVPQDGARGGRDLRLHVGGDVSCTAGARALGEAVDVLRSRGLGSAWTYTHRWRTVDREAWGPIQIFASVESAEDLQLAVRRGYAPALTVPQFQSDRAWKVRGVSIVPCPNESHPSSPTCSECRLCLDGALATTGKGVGFSAHGRDAEQARDSIADAQHTNRA
jgi:hypothetical protein